MKSLHILNLGKIHTSKLCFKHRFIIKILTPFFNSIVDVSGVDKERTSCHVFEHKDHRSEIADADGRDDNELHQGCHVTTLNVRGDG